MVKRMDLGDAQCPVARALDVVGDWWSLLIVRDAFDGISRFSRFQSHLGIARGMLSARLNALVERGIFQMQPASDGSAYKDYVLTEKGRGLFLVIVALRQWGEANLYEAGEAHSLLLEKTVGHPPKQLELFSANGGRIEWSDTFVEKCVSLQ